MTFQNLIRTLDDYWSSQGCAVLESYDSEVGAGTMHPATTLRSLGPEPWNVAYVQASRRPADGRYTLNPQRSQRYFQYQVIMKPSPENIVDLYMGSLDALGFDSKNNDIRLVEDDWESQAAGAAGVGWEVWLNGTEVSQFTFFQQMGGIDCDPVCAEITYGPERLCLMINGQDSFWDGLMWSDDMTYRTAEFEAEMQNNLYNFEVADTSLLRNLFDLYEAESKRVIETEVHYDPIRKILALDNPETQGEKAPISEALIYPALDLALKCSHIFNLLDARGAVSVTERAKYINRIRARIRACCLAYVEKFKA
ncbi:glycine--tRNA ligase subunit alpha [bacterium]|nr:glycine--tRNA ligase subunit alpha [bacterium]